MKGTFVSVIIPVYNAEKYVSRAVTSALAQPETGEVILVEDHSSDNALEVCKGLEKKHQNVRLLCHPEPRNYGAGASRNLGMSKARYDLIAFLDADDYMLPRRFEISIVKLAENPSIHGVYEAVGNQFESTEAEQWWNKKRKGVKLTTISNEVSPGQLFEILLQGKMGFFHTNGIVFRKQLLKDSGNFDPELRMCQDANLWHRMAAVGKLVGGKLHEPVAVRCVHGENRIIINESKHSSYEYLSYLKLLSWAKNNDLDESRIKLIRYRCVDCVDAWKPGNKMTCWERIVRVKRLLRLLAADYHFLSSNAWCWVTDNVVGWSRLKRKILQILGKQY